MIRYNYPPYYFPQNINMQKRNFKNTTNQALNTRENNKKETQTQITRKDENKFDNSKDDKILFEILGIKLYSDDILLLCLIFFLYNEGVQDQYLFIALILLLLS